MLMWDYIIIASIFTVKVDCVNDAGLQSIPGWSEHFTTQLQGVAAVWWSSILNFYSCCTLPQMLSRSLYRG